MCVKDNLTHSYVSDTITIQKGNKVKILNWAAAVKSENLYTLTIAETDKGSEVSLRCGE